jgi:hypothetical protein
MILWSKIRHTLRQGGSSPRVELWPNPAVNTDVPHAGLRPAAGRRLTFFG